MITLKMRLLNQIYLINNLKNMKIKKKKKKKQKK